MSETDIALLKATGVAWGLATVVEADCSQSAVADMHAAAQAFRAYAHLHEDKDLLEEAAWLESLASNGPASSSSMRLIDREPRGWQSGFGRSGTI